VKTSTGDVFVFSAAEVAKVGGIKTALLSETGESSSSGVSVYKKRGSLLFVESNQPLKPNDFLTYQGWSQYQKAKKTRVVGNAMMIAGGSLAAAFGVSAGVELFGGDFEWLYASVACAIPVVAGLVLSISGNKQLNTIANSYNQNPGYALVLGAQQHGIGFAVHF